MMKPGFPRGSIIDASARVRVTAGRVSICLPNVTAS